MKLSRFRNFIVFLFVGIFTAKMIISISPAFTFSFDSEMMNSVIMQLEVEHSENDSGKSSTKLLDSKLFCDTFNNFKLVDAKIIVNNSFIEHFKRYVDPFHPMVPTPPPNIA